MRAKVKDSGEIVDVYFIAQHGSSNTKAYRESTLVNARMWMEDELTFLDELTEQQVIYEELKALHLRIEKQTVCDDAGGNRMWCRVWQYINEGINILKDDIEVCDKYW